MSVDEALMCSFQILKPADKKKNIAGPGFNYGINGAGAPNRPPGADRPTTPPKK